MMIIIIKRRSSIITHQSSINHQSSNINHLFTSLNQTNKIKCHARLTVSGVALWCCCCIFLLCAFQRHWTHLSAYVYGLLVYSQDDQQWGPTLQRCSCLRYLMVRKTSQHPQVYLPQQHNGLSSMIYWMIFLQSTGNFKNVNLLDKKCYNKLKWQDMTW